MAAPRQSNSVRCPTCRAVQEWSDACRRCRSDLRLLRAVDAQYWDEYSRCRNAIQTGRSAEAMHHARLCHELRPTDESRRLVAIASLLNGDWHTAWRMGRSLMQSVSIGHEDVN